MVMRREGKAPVQVCSGKFTINSLFIQKIITLRQRRYDFQLEDKKKKSCSNDGFSAS